MKMLALLVCACVVWFGVAHADVAPPPADASANKALVAEMFQKMFVEKKVAEYADTYMAADFIEHDPVSTDGTKALKAFFVDYFKQNPKFMMSVKRIIAEDDLVLVHFHVQNGPEDRGLAGIDIFRLRGDKIVEHWGVLQPVPEKSANTNTMF